MNYLRFDEKNRLIVVSNRIPYNITRINNEISYKKSVGGLVTALDPILKKLKKRIEYSGKIFLFLDYDGTLTRIRKNPTKKLPHPQFLILPSVDPLSDKNRELNSDEIEGVLNSFNITRKNR